MKTSRNLSVLVIDDSVNHCSGLAELLELRGFAARCAFTGAQGLELAKMAAPDAVLLDMNLPDMSGEDVCQAIRSDSRLAKTAVIFHTGMQAPGAPHLGDAFLTYPVQTDILESVILGSIRKRQTMEQRPMTSRVGVVGEAAG